MADYLKKTLLGKIKNLCLLVASVSIALTPNPVLAAIDENLEARLDTYMGHDVVWWGDVCGDTLSAAKSSTLTFPGLDRKKMADAIDEYIEDNEPNSILLGTGEVLVNSASKANVSPFLSVAHALLESSIGKPGVSTFVDEANNSFGRSATDSQPQAAGNSKITAYLWTSGEASVDASAEENTPDDREDNRSDHTEYLRDVYGTQIDSGDLSEYLRIYVNESPEILQSYEETFTKVLSELSTASGGDGSTTADLSNVPEICCADPSASGPSAIFGGTNAEKAFNYLVSKGLTSEQAAGAVGNLMQESGGGTENLVTTAVNPTSGATGMVQWMGSRLALLQASVPVARDKLGNDALEWDSIETQLFFMGWELGLEGDIEIGGSKPTHTGPGDAMLAASDIEESTLVWLERYEIPCMPGSCQHELGIRMPFATQVFEKYGDTPSAGSGYTQVSGCGSGGGQAAEGFVYYNQSDPKWQVNGLNIALAGCGPTSLAMIVATKSDKSVEPPEVTQYLKDNGAWSEGEGMFWNAPGLVGQKYGLDIEQLDTGDISQIESHLKAGGLAVLSGMGAAPYTSGGHIIVARGMTEDGQVIVADPGRAGADSVPYDINSLSEKTKNIWIVK